MELGTDLKQAKRRIIEAQLSLDTLNLNDTCRLLLQQFPETQTQEKRTMDMRLILGFDFEREMYLSWRNRKHSCRDL